MSERALKGRDTDIKLLENRIQNGNRKMEVDASVVVRVVCAAVGVSAKEPTTAHSEHTHTHAQATRALQPHRIHHDR